MSAVRHFNLCAQNCTDGVSGHKIALNFDYWLSGAFVVVFVFTMVAMLVSGHCVGDGAYDAGYDSMSPCGGTSGVVLLSCCICEESD